MNKAKGERQKAKVKRESAGPAARLLHLCLLPFAFCLPRSGWPFAFCLLPSFALVFLSWSLPSGFRERARVPAASRASEEEVDQALQRASASALGGREGAVLVRAAVGARVAFEEATPPGSAIKPFTMLAALRAGVLEEETRAFCRGRYEREGFRVACSHPRYRNAFGPVQALANSCNYFFARTAEALDGEQLARTLREFGFGAQTRGGGDSEAAGGLPRPAARGPRTLGGSGE